MWMLKIHVDIIAPPCGFDKHLYMQHLKYEIPRAHRIFISIFNSKSILNWQNIIRIRLFNACVNIKFGSSSPFDLRRGYSIESFNLFVSCLIFVKCTFFVFMANKNTCQFGKSVFVCFCLFVIYHQHWIIHLFCLFLNIFFYHWNYHLFKRICNHSFETFCSQFTYFVENNKNNSFFQFTKKSFTIFLFVCFVFWFSSLLICLIFFFVSFSLFIIITLLSLFLRKVILLLFISSIIYIYRTYTRKNKVFCFWFAYSLRIAIFFHSSFYAHHLLIVCVYFFCVISVVHLTFVCESSVYMYFETEKKKIKN